MSIITIIKEAALEALFTIDTIGSEPVSVECESSVHTDWSLQTLETKRQLKILSRIPVGQLAMLESADYDLSVIGMGTPHMTVR